MLCLASGECTQNKEYGMNDYYKREPLNNKNSYKKITYWAVEMKDVFIYCEEHITGQNTWGGGGDGDGGGNKKEKKPSYLQRLKKKKRLQRDYLSRKKAVMEIYPKILKREYAQLYLQPALHFSMNSSRRHTPENDIQILKLLVPLKVCYGKRGEKIF